jgi:phosphocarrier protein HPr
MIKTSITISNKLGLHARASAKLTKHRRVNAKSIMGVMMLAAGLGSEVEIEADGVDEAKAIDGLVALIKDKFGESE